MNKIVILVLIAIVIFGGFKIAKELRPTPKTSDIKISGNQVTFSWQGIDISAKLGSKQTIYFFTNGGGSYSQNSANFSVIPMDKIRYLEQKYSDFIHCGSPGESEAKSSSFPIEILANNSSVERNLGKLEDLVKKQNLVVFKIEGLPLQQIQGNKSGKSFSIMTQGGLLFYLIDDLQIIQEHYK